MESAGSGGKKEAAEGKGGGDGWGDGDGWDDDFDASPAYPTLTAYDRNGVKVAGLPAPHPCSATAAHHALPVLGGPYPNRAVQTHWTERCA